MSKRVFDLFAAMILIIVLSFPMLAIALMIKLDSRGPVLYWSNRIGLNNKIFNMPKFRTMHLGSPVVATHLFTKPEQYVTRIGAFLRKYSLDELPQLLSIISGDMTFIGPRPALFNQDDLIKIRTIRGIHKLIPGVTGWAQVNGRDNLTIAKKVEFDEYYLKNRSLCLNNKILFMTIIKTFHGEDVQH